MIILVVLVILIVGGLIAGIVVSLLRVKEPTTVILISFDGFRAEYLELGVNPNLMQLGLLSSTFPSFLSANQFCGEMTTNLTYRYHHSQIEQQRKE